MKSHAGIENNPGNFYPPSKKQTSQLPDSGAGDTQFSAHGNQIRLPVQLTAMNTP